MENYDTYTQEFTEFANKHNKNGKGWKVTTSEMVNDTYMKTYSWEDGANWWEVCRPVTEKGRSIIKGVVVDFTVKLFCIEYWNTESRSKFVYQQF